MHQPAIPSDITEKPKGVFAIGGGVGSMLAVIDLAEARLNPYLVDIVNLREHCAWVHPNDPAGATRKKCEFHGRRARASCCANLQTGTPSRACGTGDRRRIIRNGYHHSCRSWRVTCPALFTRQPSRLQWVVGRPSVGDGAKRDHGNGLSPSIQREMCSKGNRNGLSK